MPQVPVVLVDGEQVNDSSAIISRLAAEVEAARRQGAGGSSGVAGAGGSGKKAGGFLSGLFGGGDGGGEGAGSAGSLAAESAAEEEKWRRWVDDWFVKVRGAFAARLA